MLSNVSVDLEELFDEEVLADGFYSWHSRSRAVNSLRYAARLHRASEMTTVCRGIAAINTLRRHAFSMRHQRANLLLAAGMARSRALSRGISAWIIYRRQQIERRFLDNVAVRHHHHHVFQEWLIRSRVARSLRLIVLSAIAFFNSSAARRAIAVWRLATAAATAATIQKAPSLAISLKRALRLWRKHTLSCRVASSVYFLTRLRTAQRFVSLLRTQAALRKGERINVSRNAIAVLHLGVLTWRRRTRRACLFRDIQRNRCVRLLIIWRDRAQADAAHTVASSAFTRFASARLCRTALATWNLNLIARVKLRRLKTIANMNRRRQIMASTLSKWRSLSGRRSVVYAAGRVLEASTQRNAVIDAVARIAIASHRALSCHRLLIERSALAQPFLLHVRSRIRIWREWAVAHRIAGRQLLESLEVGGGWAVARQRLRDTTIYREIPRPIGSPLGDNDDDPFEHVAAHLERACKMQT